MKRHPGKTLRRRIVCAAAVALFAAGADARNALSSAETSATGAWDLEAVHKNGAFDRCAITRTLDKRISVSFVRAGQSLTLRLASPHWQLDAGESYPVTLKLGPGRWDRDMNAETNAVSMAIEDKDLMSTLRAANALEVIAAGDTIRVPLDGSRAAFERLDRCVAQNGPAERRARPGVVLSGEEGRPATTSGVTGPNLMEDIAAGEDGPPPPTEKPDVSADNAGELADEAVEAPGEDVPPPVAKPQTEAVAAESAASDPVEAEPQTPPPAAKPEKAPVKPAVTKASPKKKPVPQSSAQTVKRAFQREVDRLRRFFGN